MPDYTKDFRGATPEKLVKALFRPLKGRPAPQKRTPDEKADKTRPPGSRKS